MENIWDGDGEGRGWDGTGTREGERYIGKGKEQKRDIIQTVRKYKMWKYPERKCLGQDKGWKSEIGKNDCA